MAAYYVGFPLLILTAVFDTTIMSLLRVWGAGPNLMLVMILSWAMLVDIRESLPWALMGGIMRDLLSITPTGVSALIFVLMIIVIDTYLPKLDWRNVIVPPVVIGLATIVYDVLVLGILVMTGRPVPELLAVIYIILPGVIENMVIVLLVFRVMGGINTFLRPSRRSLQ